ncbi:MAG: hypothetical protein ABIH46_10920 [Chloroflexota bacterium]
MISERVIKALRSAWVGDPWPLLGEVANLWLQSKAPELAKAVNGEGAVVSDPVEAAKTEFLEKLRRRDFGLLLIMGRRGSGKTALSLRLVEFIGKRRNFAIGIPRKKLPAHIEALDDELTLENLDSSVPNGSVVVIDDAGLFYGAGSYRTANTKALQKLLDICRHREVILIVNVQRAASLDRRLCDPDIVFLKPPSLMYMRSEDEALKRFMKPAEEAFAALAEKSSIEAWKSHVYVVSDDFEGMIEYELPQHWSEALTKNKR